MEVAKIINLLKQITCENIILLFATIISHNKRLYFMSTSIFWSSQSSRLLQLKQAVVGKRLMMQYDQVMRRLKLELENGCQPNISCTQITTTEKICVNK